MKLGLISYKIGEFVKLAKNDELSKEKIEKAAKKIKNGEDAQRIISKEIIPIAREMHFEFTTNEFINYLKRSENANELSEDELGMASGGSDMSSRWKGKKVSIALGITEATVSIASLATGVGFATSPLPNLSQTMNLGINANSQELANRKESNEVVAKGLRSLLSKEGGKVQGPEVEEKIVESSSNSKDKIEKKNDFAIKVEDTDYKVSKIEEIEEERAIVINDSLGTEKAVKIPDEPLTVEGKWLPIGKATYSATVVILPKDAKAQYNNHEWEKIRQKDGSTVYIKRGSEAYKNQQALKQKDKS